MNSSSQQGHHRSAKNDEGDRARLGDDDLERGCGEAGGLHIYWHTYRITYLRFAPGSGTVNLESPFWGHDPMRFLMAKPSSMALTT